MISELHLVVNERTAFTGTMHNQPTLEELKQADKHALQQMAKELGEGDCVITEVDDLRSTLCCDGQMVAMFRRTF